MLYCLLYLQRQKSIAEVKMAIREWLGQISVPVYVLVMLFAISSWVDVNGLWVELPLLVNALPEGWSLPSYLAIIIQVANIGPIAYTIANRLAPNRVKEWPVIYVIVVVGAAACLLLAVFWRHTSFILGTEHSTALISLAALLALVDCTSSVVFLPYMAAFKPQYMTALYIGEGLSGLVPGLVGLVQSVSSDPNCVNTTETIHNTTTGLNHTEWVVVPVYPKPVFSVEAFFFFLFCMLVVSLVAFSLLHWLPYCRQERLQVSLTHVASSHVVFNQANKEDERETANRRNSNVQNADSNDKNGSYEAVGKTNGGDTSTVATLPASRDDDGRDPSLPRLGSTRFILLLALTAWLNALTNGLLASTQSYSNLPYGSMAYTLAVRLSAVANPIACLLALFVMCKTVGMVFILILVGTALAGYQLFLAAASPSPPLLGTVTGEALAVSTDDLLK